MCVVLCYSLTNAEEVLALAIQQLIGYRVNVTIVEGANHAGYSDQVMYTEALWAVPAASCIIC